jgi:hypothetical protein
MDAIVETGLSFCDQGDPLLGRRVIGNETTTNGG